MAKIFYSVPVYGLKLVKERTVRYAVRAIETPNSAASLIASLIGACDREHFVAVFLDAKAAPTGVTIISVGTLDSTLVTPREVFKAAIAANATSIVLGHNHPSGNTDPSPEDLATTKHLVAAGKVLGINIIDHVIVTTEGRFASMFELGLLQAA